MKLKRILCTTLAAALLAVPAFAVDGEGGDTPSNPGTSVGMPLAPGGEEGKTDALDFNLITQEKLGPIMTYGFASELGESTLRIQNSNEYAAVSDVVLNITDETIILDAVTGESRAFEDIRESDTIYAYISPVMTRSLPPISNAILVLCNIPADFGVPIWAEVEQVIPGEEGKVSFLMDNDIVLHLDGEAELLPYLTKDVVGLDAIVPGTRLLSWYSMVLESFPGQAYPTKVMVFPSAYTGYVDIKTTDGISLNGEKLDITPLVAEDGTLMLPVRAFAEALGCTVTWNAADPTLVTVEKDGSPLYSFRAGETTATVEGDMVMELTAPALARDKATYLPAQDLVGYHGLKLVGRWPV